MNGIDISSAQAGMDLGRVFAESDTDFVIVKVSQGTTYINPYWREWADEVLDSGKLLGLYHYANGYNAYAEAEYFYNLARPYMGKAIMCLDWESEIGGGARNPSFNDHGIWTKVWHDRFVELSGIEPFLYSNPWCMSLNPSFRYRWAAQYDNYVPSYYQEHPWKEGEYECEIRQYKGTGGRVAGFGDRDVDLNKAYFTREEWMRMAGNEDYATTAEQALDAARSHLGETGNKFNNWAGWPSDTPWCAIFQSYVLVNDCGMDVAVNASAAGLCLEFDGVPFESVTPGDLVFFGWDGIRSVYFRDASHVAMVESVNDDGTFWTIEGNSMWGDVHRTLRNVNASYYCAFFRPPYGVAHNEEEDDMAAADVVIKQMLIEDAYRNMLHREPDTWGLAFQLRATESASLVSVMASIATSEEAERFEPSQRVEGMYRAFLGRDPESVDVVDDWISAAEERGWWDVACGIFNSDEGTKRRKTIGL